MRTHQPLMNAIHHLVGRSNLWQFGFSISVMSYHNFRFQEGLRNNRKQETQMQVSQGGRFCDYVLELYL